MKVLPEPLSFEWDAGNSNKNFLRHNVTNQEAEESFFNEPAFLFEDEKHSQHEKRHMLWGETNKGRKLAVFFTIRRAQVRVISARDMHKKEKTAYEKIKKSSTA